MTAIADVREDVRLPPFARTYAGGIAAATTLLLLAVSPWYGYHRDELYFRLLGEHPKIGYFDTPPLTPMIARVSTALFGDTVVALRVVPALCTGALIVLIALMARELGGDRSAQVLAAAGTATGLLPLVGGHTLLTLTPDLVLWTTVVVMLLRVLLRGDGRYWPAIGLVSGVATYNRDLIVMLLASVGVGVLVAGPRRIFADRRLWLGALIAVVVAAPNLIYQMTHGWPQFQMAAALGADDGANNRVTFVPLQILLLGVPQFVIGIAGWRRLWRNRATRAPAIAYPVACAFTLYSGGRPDYVGAFLLYLFAAGCVSAAGWRLRGLTVGALAVSGALMAVVALPVVPAASLDGSPVATINEVARESVGMHDVADQVAWVVRTLSPTDRAQAVLLAGNYGEAGAFDRWAGDFGLPKVYSGHNELWWWGPPPETARVVVAVNYDERFLSARFARCSTAGSLHGMPGEEDGVPIVVCHDPLRPWREMWPDMRHYS
ncbi:hypothetical protein Pth03_31760 [Planotetraspora thailandica]|uniref:Glycosyltransferase RgtA/B/C/D-like domain-containing protein n=1 Tax=Planotetraspora thailandica TaxID=487172 RepID=A0A8J3XTW4_9ACTN|nr:glycosyltransferase family 39 protein [Planotetraspora thailandica]GII54787.1 hypothetical protein Pth03_31760 [Planotetraspora thailandica]